MNLQTIQVVTSTSWGVGAPWCTGDHYLQTIQVNNGQASLTWKTMAALICPSKVQGNKQTDNIPSSTHNLFPVQQNLDLNSRNQVSIFWTNVSFFTPKLRFISKIWANEDEYWIIMYCGWFCQIWTEIQICDQFSA